MIEIEPEILTAAPLIGADFTQNAKAGEMGKTSRRQSNPPAAGGSWTAAPDASGICPTGHKPAAESEMLPTGNNPGAQLAPVLPAAKPDETPEALFSAAVRSINKRYQLGTLAHIEDHLPELDRLINDAFNQMNDIWERTLPGGRLDSFKLALRAWYGLIIRAIELFEDFKNDQ